MKKTPKKKAPPAKPLRYKGRLIEKAGNGLYRINTPEGHLIRGFFRTLDLAKAEVDILSP